VSREDGYLPARLAVSVPGTEPLLSAPTPAARLATGCGGGVGHPGHDSRQGTAAYPSEPGPGPRPGRTLPATGSLRRPGRDQHVHRHDGRAARTASVRSTRHLTTAATRSGGLVVVRSAPTAELREHYVVGDARGLEFSEAGEYERIRDIVDLDKRDQHDVADAGLRWLDDIGEGDRLRARSGKSEHTNRYTQHDSGTHVLSDGQAPVGAGLALHTWLMNYAKKTPLSSDLCALQKPPKAVPCPLSTVSSWGRSQATGRRCAAGCPDLLIGTTRRARPRRSSQFCAVASQRSRGCSRRDRRSACSSAWRARAPWWTLHRSRPVRSG